jgi:hypothetical protein
MVHCIGWEHPTSNGRLNCCTQIELEQGKHKHNFPKRCQACREMVLRLQQVVQQNEKRGKAGKAQRSRSSLRDLAAKHYPDRQFPDHQTFVGPSQQPDDASESKTWAPAARTKCVKCSATLGALMQDCVLDARPEASDKGEANFDGGDEQSDSSEVRELEGTLFLQDSHGNSADQLSLFDGLLMSSLQTKPLEQPDTESVTLPRSPGDVETLSGFWPSSPSIAEDDVLMADTNFRLPHLADIRMSQEDKPLDPTNRDNTHDCFREGTPESLGAILSDAQNECEQNMQPELPHDSPRSGDSPRDVHRTRQELDEAESATVEVLATLHEARPPPAQPRKSAPRFAVQERGCIRKRSAGGTAGQQFHRKWLKRNLELLARYLS